MHSLHTLLLFARFKTSAKDGTNISKLDQLSVGHVIIIP